MLSLARFAAVPLSLAISACTITINTDFAPPNKTSLVIGQSTERDVLAVEGPPQSETVTTARQRIPDRPQFDWASSGVKHYDVLRYSYSQAILDDVTVYRAASFFLADGRLAGWTFVSDDPSQSTNFDLLAAQRLLASGMPDIATLKSAIGPPSGQMSYPLTSASNIRELSWGYIGNDKNARNRVAKTLSILVGSDDKIINYYIHQDDLRSPAALTRAVIVPIILR